MYIHVHVGMYLYVQGTDMSVHCTDLYLCTRYRHVCTRYRHVCTWYRHVCTVLPNPVQVVRIPDGELFVGRLILGDLTMYHKVYVIFVRVNSYRVFVS